MKDRQEIMENENKILGIDTLYINNTVVSWPSAMAVFYSLYEDFMYF